MEKEVLETYCNVVVEILRRKQFTDQMDMIPVADIREEFHDYIDKAIEQLLKEGRAYQPRHGFIRLVSR